MSSIICAEKIHHPLSWLKSSIQKKTRQDSSLYHWHTFSKMQNRVQVIVYLLCTGFFLFYCFLYESVTCDTVWSLHAMVAQRRKRTHIGPENIQLILCLLVTWIDKNIVNQEWITCSWSKLREENNFGFNCVWGLIYSYLFMDTYWLHMVIMSQFLGIIVHFCENESVTLENMAIYASGICGIESTRALLVFFFVHETAVLHRSASCSPPLLVQTPVFQVVTFNQQSSITGVWWSKCSLFHALWWDATQQR